MVHACVVGDGDVMWQFQRYRREGGGDLPQRRRKTKYRVYEVHIQNLKGLYG